MTAERGLTLATRDGVSLEARLTGPERPRGGLVVCHPHPLYGGDMENPVVVRLAEVAGAAGLAALRFNFRGAGRSTGRHDGGRAERHDVEAALAHLAALRPAGTPLLLAGYSFGAVVSARVADAGPETPLDGLILVAPPVGLAGEAPFTDLAGTGLPLLVVVGTRDEYAPLPAVQQLAGRLPRARLEVIEGASHFFFGKLYPLGEAVRAWLHGLEARQPGGGGGPR